MSNFSLKAGTRISVQGRNCVVQSCTSNRVRLCDTNTHEIRTETLATLRQSLQNGSMQIEDLLAGPTCVSGEPELVPKGLTEYPELERKAAMRRRHYLRWLCPHGPMRCRRSEVVTALHDAWSQLPMEERGSGPPSVSTFYSWRHKWLRHDRMDAACVPGFARRGRRPAPVPDELRPILERAVDRYATDTRPTVKQVLDEAAGLVNRQNEHRPPSMHLPRPTRRQIERELASMDRYLMIERREGRTAAKASTAVYGKGPGAQRLLERVEADHTPIDLICVANDRVTRLGRPWLTALIDVASRMIVGIWISFDQPSANTILSVLKLAILPKDSILAEHKLNDEWPAHGIPLVIVVDNGPEFHSSALKAAAQDLGITIIYCPKEEPRFKGCIERFLRTLNHGLVHTLPGTTFSNVEDRGDYDSSAKAVLTIDELRRLVTKWVVEIYARSFHRGIRTSPLDRWNQLAAIDPPVLPRRLDVLDVYLRPVEQRTLSSKGIEYDSLFYGGSRLDMLRSKHGNTKLTIRPDDQDLGSLHVLDPDANAYFKAPCTWPQYADGLTRRQHEKNKEQARRRYAALPHEQAMLATKLDMAAEVAAMTQHGRAIQNATSECSQGEDAKHEATDLKVSFEDVEAFPIGQTELFKSSGD